MEKLFYSIADLAICIETPHCLDISGESEPFLKSEKTDFAEIITLVPVDSLQTMQANGIWHQDRYYVATPEGETFHIRATPGAQPYAVIDYRSGHRIRVVYLRDSRDMVFQTGYLLNMLGLEQLLLRHNGLILHASLIRWKEQGILFSAPSGVGKSTQASLWERYQDAEILNGDRAGIRCIDGCWTACGLPYAGSSHIYRNASAPIRTIVVLQQGPENVIRLMTEAEALRALLPEFSAHRWNPEFMSRLLDIASAMLHHVPAYCLQCRPDRGAVELLCNTLNKEETI